MSSEDYLVRQFQQMGKVFAKLLGMHEKKQYRQAIDEIDQVLNSWFDMDASSLDSLKVEDLLGELAAMKNASFETYLTLAELLYHRAVSLKDLEQYKEATASADLARGLFKYIQKEKNSFSFDQQQKIATLDKILSGHKK